MTGVEEEARHKSNGHPTCQEFLAVDLPSSTRVSSNVSVFRCCVPRCYLQRGAGQEKEKGEEKGEEEEEEEEEEKKEETVVVSESNSR